MATSTLLPDRPKEGTHHPRRPQHRPGEHRRAAAPASGRATRRRGRPPRRARWRTAGCLCAAQGRRLCDGGRAAVVRQRADHRTRRDAQGDQAGSGHAADRRRQDLQARAQAARDADALRTALHEAGASISRLDVTNDAQFGIQVEVIVAGSANADIAREVLGQFPFRFRASWTNSDQ